jgi:hypothetical protein
MNWKEYGRKWSWPNLRYYSSIFKKELRKEKKTSGRITCPQAEI